MRVSIVYVCVVYLLFCPASVSGIAMSSGGECVTTKFTKFLVYSINDYASLLWYPIKLLVLWTYAL